MDIHKNVRLTPLGRAELVGRVLEEGQTLTAFEVCPSLSADGSTASRRKDPKACGIAPPSRTGRAHPPTPAPVVERIEALRRERWTRQQIAVEVGVSPATVSCVPNRLG